MLASFQSALFTQRLLVAVAGEGCSAEGGCASCPYMKMNSLQALMSVCTRFGSPAGEALLEANRPRAYTELIGGRSMAKVPLPCFPPPPSMAAEEGVRSA